MRWGSHKREIQPQAVLLYFQSVDGLNMNMFEKRDEIQIEIILSPRCVSIFLD